MSKDYWDDYRLLGMNGMTRDDCDDQGCLGFLGKTGMTKVTRDDYGRRGSLGMTGMTRDDQG